MESAKRIEEKLNKIFDSIRQKEAEIEDLKKITKTLYDELLKVKKNKDGKLPVN